MADRFVATGPIDVGSPDGEVKHYEKGDEVPGAEGFKNLQSLLDSDRLEKKSSRSSGSSDGPTKSTRKRSTAKRTAAKS